jgi:c-di-GMP-binding flagellar brake protein YcgR
MMDHVGEGGPWEVVVAGELFPIAVAALGLPFAEASRDAAGGAAGAEAGVLADFSGGEVESTCEFNEGDGLMLRGAVGDGEVVPFRAVVVWRSFSFRLHRYGLRFDGLSPAARDAIERFVNLTAARWKKKRK